MDVTECEKHEMIGCVFCAPTTGTIRVTDHARSPKPTPAHPWSDDEINLAKDPTVSDEELARVTGRTVAAVHVYRLKHHFVEKRHNRRINYSAARAMARWTTLEEAYLLANAAEDLAKIAEALGRSARAVQRKLRDLLPALDQGVQEQPEGDPDHQ